MHLCTPLMPSGHALDTFEHALATFGRGLDAFGHALDSFWARNLCIVYAFGASGHA